MEDNNVQLPYISPALQGIQFTDFSSDPPTVLGEEEDEEKKTKSIVTLSSLIELK